MVGLVLLFLVAFFCGLVYLSLRIAKRVAGWRYRDGKLTVGVVVMLDSLAHLPGCPPVRVVYRADFEREAGFELPGNARFVAGNASFLDHFGDYCSSCRF